MARQVPAAEHETAEIPEPASGGCPGAGCQACTPFPPMLPARVAWRFHFNVGRTTETA
jgi:hypothetical protein